MNDPSSGWLPTFVVVSAAICVSVQAAKAHLAARLFFSAYVLRWQRARMPVWRSWSRMIGRQLGM